MIVTCVYIQVKPGFVKEFIEASIRNHQASVLEPGNLRFDILQQMDDPCLFTFYEAYESEEAVLAHKETAHYLNWRNTVEPYMAIPRKGVKHSVIQPLDQALW